MNWDNITQKYFEIENDLQKKSIKWHNDQSNQKINEKLFFNDHVYRINNQYLLSDYYYVTKFDNYQDAKFYFIYNLIQAGIREQVGNYSRIPGGYIFNIKKSPEFLENLSLVYDNLDQQSINETGKHLHEISSIATCRSWGWEAGTVIGTKIAKPIMAEEKEIHPGIDFLPPLKLPLIIRNIPIVRNIVGFVIDQLVKFEKIRDSIVQNYTEAWDNFFNPFKKYYIIKPEYSSPDNILEYIENSYIGKIIKFEALETRLKENRLTLTDKTFLEKYRSTPLKDLNNKLEEERKAHCIEHTDREGKEEYSSAMNNTLKKLEEVIKLYLEKYPESTLKNQESKQSAISPDNFKKEQPSNEQLGLHFRF